LRNAYWDLFNEVSNAMDFSTYCLYKDIGENIDEKINDEETD